MTSQECEGIFTVAGIPFTNKWELTNQYWPRAYPDMVLNNPWWLVETPMGLIRIGWRKPAWTDDQAHAAVSPVRRKSFVPCAKSVTTAYCAAVLVCD